MALPLTEPVEADAQTLRLIAEQACTRAGCVAAGMTMVRGDLPPLVVGTSLLGGQLEQAQWDLGQGPGLDAMRQLQVFNVACLVTTFSWPDFAAHAVTRGVRSSLAMPIILRGRAIGALDLYSLDPGGFEGAERVGLHFAATAAVALSAAGPWAGPVPPRPAPEPARQGRSRAVS